MTESGVAEAQEPITDSPTFEESTAEPVEETTAHQATCTHDGCDVGALFEPNVTGTGFVVLECYGCDIETTFGVGPNARPLCPNGHGEMALADDRLPAHEAIAQAAAMQQSLPGIIPPFNYQGAYLELESKAVECDALHREYEDAASIAKDAKKRWDKAAEAYTKIALELRRRRREKVENGDAISDLAPEGEQQELQAEPEKPAEQTAASTPETPAEPEVAHRYPKRGKKKTRSAPIHPQPKKRAKKKAGK